MVFVRTSDATTLKVAKVSSDMHEAKIIENSKLAKTVTTNKHNLTKSNAKL